MNMDEEFITKVKRDFVNLKYSLSDHNDIADCLKIDPQICDKTINLLRSSKESGYIEARETLLKKIFVVLEDGKFKALKPESINEAVSLATQLVFITAIDIKITSGDIIAKKAGTKGNFDDVKDIDLKSIVKNILSLTKEHDELEDHKEVKTIKLRLKEYYRELEKSKELIKNIAKEKRELFLQNVQKALSNILTGIKRNYFNILEHLKEEESILTIEVDLLSSLDFRTLQPVLLKQLSGFTQLWSSFTYIKSNYYNIQSIIERMYNKLDEFIKLLEDEKKALFSVFKLNKISDSKMDELIVSINEMMIKIIDRKYKPLY